MRTHPSTGTPRMRLSILAVVIVCLFASLLARLWYLQVINAPAARAAARENGVRLVYTEAPRGRILDRLGRVLVGNRLSEVVSISRDTAASRPGVMSRLEALLGVSDEQLRRRVTDPRYSPFRPVPVAEDVDKAKIVYLREHAEEFPGVEADSAAVRWYPYGSLAANVVGYTGEIDDRQLASRKKLGYRPGDLIGESGVEAAYDDALRGQSGVTKLQVDSRGRVLGVLGSRPPVQGHDVELTIDVDVQALAEVSLAQGLLAARQSVDKLGTKADFKAPGGAATVLDPRDGSVLALATYPTYDPADFVNGISPAKFEAYAQDPSGPLDDRAIQGTYAPGSTFKLVTAVAGLQAGLVTPTSAFVDKGFVQVGPQRFYNDKRSSYGHITLPLALAVSSDAYFYDVGARLWSARGHLGDNALQNAARRFGFGSATKIALPGEASGRIPDPAYNRRLHDANPQAFPDPQWYTGNSVITAVGQGNVAVTPLQLADAYATFANGGTLWQPRIAERILSGGRSAATDVVAVASGHLDLPASVRDPILDGLEQVVANPSGTAYAAFSGFPLAEYPIAAKTGTAQVQGKQATSVFASFAPAGDPRYVVDAFLEQAGYGADTAAPVVRRIYEGLFGQAVAPVVSVRTGVD